MDAQTLTGLAFIVGCGALWIGACVLAACMRASQISRKRGE